MAAYEFQAEAQAALLERSADGWLRPKQGLTLLAETQVCWVGC